MATPAQKRLIWAAFFGAPVLCLLIGLAMFVGTIQFLGRSERVQAEVVEVEVQRLGQGKRVTELQSGSNNISVANTQDELVFEETFRAILQFDLDGQTHQAPTHIQSKTYNYDIGRVMRVRVDPADPSEVRIAGLWSLWGFPVLLTLIGGGLLAVVVAGRKQLAEKLEKM
jgi:Uncharacterized protein involved in biosynthesis of c-type cytochromes